MHTKILTFAAKTKLVFSFTNGIIEEKKSDSFKGALALFREIKVLGKFIRRITVPKNLSSLNITLLIWKIQGSFWCTVNLPARPYDSDAWRARCFNRVFTGPRCKRENWLRIWSASVQVWSLLSLRLLRSPFYIIIFHIFCIWVLSSLFLKKFIRS